MEIIKERITQFSEKVIWVSVDKLVFVKETVSDVSFIGGSEGYFFQPLRKRKDGV